jgi:hypothetical protein
MTQELFECGGRIVGGKLKIEGRVVFEQTMARFEDGPVTVRITVGKKTRSLQQNRYWHGIVVPLFAEHCGYGHAEMKDALALELIPHEVVNLKTGEISRAPGHTSQLTVDQFNELIVRAQALGATMGIYVPDPNEVAA